MIYGGGGKNNQRSENSKVKSNIFTPVNGKGTTKTDNHTQLY